jgi:hypothetical protein
MVVMVHKQQLDRIEKKLDKVFLAVTEGVFEKEDSRG